VQFRLRRILVLKEFREFAVQGNMLDIAVGLVIGVAFGAIVSSLVDDILMPPVGLVLGGADFSQLFVVLQGDGTFNTIEQAKAAGAVTLNVGLFINALIKFVIIAFALFLVVKGVNALRRQQAIAPVPRSEVLLEEIRDLLATGR
jgi:large conductance mechanosensitive channel